MNSIAQVSRSTARPAGFKALVILLHAVAGWAFCGAVIGISRQIVPLQSALVIHAIAAPLGFAGISLFYFRRFAFTNPLQTASAFLGIVLALDLFLVAPVFEHNFAMFGSLLGTWIPFALIFTSVYVTGRIAGRPTA